MMFVAYISILLVAAIILYAVCRAVDHHFTIREEEDRAIYKSQLINHAFDDVKWLTEDMLKKINDQWQNMFKEGAE